MIVSQERVVVLEVNSKRRKAAAPAVKLLQEMLLPLPLRLQRQLQVPSQEGARTARPLGRQVQLRVPSVIILRRQLQRDLPNQPVKQGLGLQLLQVLPRRAVHQRHPRKVHGTVLSDRQRHQKLPT